MPRDSVKAQAWRTAYYRSHQEHIRTLRLEYASAHREELRIRRAPYYKAYYAAHASTERQRSRAWYKRHRERALAASKIALQRWRLANPEKAQAQTQRKLALRRGLPASLTPDQWKAIKRAYGFRCAYCGKRKLLTQDHVVPAFHGGGYTPDNIVPACGSCNSAKGVGLPPKIPALRLLL